MNANLAVIADNLDYLLWGRLAEGQPGGVALTLLMAIGATLLALPGGIALAGSGLALRRAGAASAVSVGGNYPRHPADICHLLAVVSAADADRRRSARRGDRDLALAWFTAASVMHSVLAGLQSLPKGQYEAALTRVRSRANAAPGAAPAGAAQRSAVAGGDLYRPAEGHFAGVYRQRPGADHRGRPGQQPGADLSPAIFVFTGAVYYLLCCGLSLLASRRFTRRATTR